MRNDLRRTVTTAARRLARRMNETTLYTMNAPYPRTPHRSAR